MELIQFGKQKIIFAGGSDEIHFAMTAMFDAMTALSSKYNDNPEKASRPYDKTRDGFVISGGGGVLVLEEYEHAKSRGAKAQKTFVFPTLERGMARRSKARSKSLGDRRIDLAS